MKTCKNPICSVQNPQPYQNFKRRAKGKDGYSARCRTCELIMHRKWVFKNKNKLLRQARERYRKNPQKERDKSRNHRKKLKYWPHLTIKQAAAEWNKMYENQGGLCAICFEKKPLVVEHCHKTLKVRSLTCNGCNSALGFIKENIQTAKNIIKYIQEHNNVNEQ